MRLIGHLADKTAAATFSDFLYVQGIGNDVESEKDGWAIWVHGEDEVPRARDLLEQFKINPSDPRYHKGAAQAQNLKVQERIEEAQARDRYYEKYKIFREVRPYGMGPFTLAVVLACVAITIYTSKHSDFAQRLYITSYWIEGNLLAWHPGLPEIRNGELWRLITPIFMHGGLVHLAFNALAMLDLGSMIEARRGSLRLAGLIIVLAIASNLAQYAFSIPSLKDWPDIPPDQRFRGGPAFVGISGVAFCLMGYIWMKSRFDPNSGLFMPRQSVAMMLVWFGLCIVGVIPHIANTAHTAGLLLGMAIGYGSSLLVRRRTGN